MCRISCSLVSTMDDSTRRYKRNKDSIQDFTAHAVGCTKVSFVHESPGTPASPACPPACPSTPRRSCWSSPAAESVLPPYASSTRPRRPCTPPSSAKRVPRCYCEERKRRSNLTPSSLSRGEDSSSLLSLDGRPAPPLLSLDGRGLR